MDAWDEERQLTGLLGAWAVVSVVGGGALARRGDRAGRPTVAAFGRQNALWGAVDGVIALTAAAARRRRRLSGLPEADRSAAADDVRRRLRRILGVNAGLDVAYVTGGSALVLGYDRIDARFPGRGSQAVGNGLAVVLQGSFLLVLDTVFARRLVRPTHRTSLPGAHRG